MQVRRVVTGIDADGRSVVSWDDSERTTGGADGGVVWIWSTTSMPPELAGSDPTLQEWKLQPPPNGVNWQLVICPPGVERTAMHETNTVDLVMILSGEIWLMLDDQEVRLGPYDSVVQRATIHAWQNRGTETALMLVSMISTEV